MEIAVVGIINKVYLIFEAIWSYSKFYNHNEYVMYIQKLKIMYEAINQFSIIVNGITYAM